MGTKIRLQLRKASADHKVFQMIVPKWIAKKLGWTDKTVLELSVRGKFLRACNSEDME
jgi:hypothetical protein